MPKRRNPRRRAPVQPQGPPIVERIAEGGTDRTPLRTIQVWGAAGEFRHEHCVALELRDGCLIVATLDGRFIGYPLAAVARYEINDEIPEDQKGEIGNVYENGVLVQGMDENGNGPDGQPVTEEEIAELQARRRQHDTTHIAHQHPGEIVPIAVPESEGVASEHNDSDQGV